MTPTRWMGKTVTTPKVTVAFSLVPSFCTEIIIIIDYIEYYLYKCSYIVKFLVSFVVPKDSIPKKN